MKKEMKIAELLDSYFPCIDGPINVVTYYSEQLDKLAECKLIVPKAKKRQKYVDQRPFEVIRCDSTAAPEG